MEEYFFTAEEEDINKRLDLFVTEEIDEISRSAVQRLIETGAILINGKTEKSNYKIRRNDTIAVIVPDPVSVEILAENIPLDILFEDEHVIVINKQKGMVVHPAPGHYTGTLVNALMFHCQGSLSGINGVMRPGIVHRIDKDTSGILVVAKSDLAHNSLSAQLAAHSMLREYYAVVFNGFDEDEGRIDKPIIRHLTERKKMSIAREGGRHAVTNYVVKERLGKYTLIAARLETGRTHQIRVHMSSIGHALLGDMVYGHAKQPVKVEGQVLHARLLGFAHPLTKEYMEFSAPLPDYFEDVLIRLRRANS